MIKFVCTDNGRHKKRLLGGIEDSEDIPDDVIRRTPQKRWVKGEPKAHVFPGTVRLRCSSCGRDVQWSASWPKILAGIRAAGLRELDISRS